MENLDGAVLVATDDAADDDVQLIRQDRVWQDDGWTARVIKNEDDDGWAVAMIPDGQSEPALVGPWTMGRDKKNPKPLDAVAFATLVKTASEVIRRHEQQRHAMLHKTLYLTHETRNYKITLDIVPDDDDPYAVLTAFDETGEAIGNSRVEAGYRFNSGNAVKWIEAGFRVRG